MVFDGLQKLPLVALALCIRNILPPKRAAASLGPSINGPTRYSKCRRFKSSPLESDFTAGPGLPGIKTVLPNDIVIRYSFGIRYPGPWSQRLCGARYRD